MRELPDDVVRLLGAVDDLLIATGNRLWWIDARGGNIVGRWPETDNKAIRAAGRGAIAGNRIYWPTRDDQLLIFPTRPSVGRGGAITRIGQINLPEHGAESGNIVITKDRVLLAAPDKLFALGSTPPAKESPVLKTAAADRHAPRTPGGAE